MIVEDEGATAMGIQRSLEEMGYTVTSVETTAEGAVNKVLIDKPDLVLMDISLAGKMDGIEAAEKIVSGSNIPIVYITAHSDEKIVRRMMKTEPFGYIIKPFDERDLGIAVEIAIYKHGMETKLRESENKFHSLFNNAADCIFLFSPSTDDFIIEDLNPAACAMHGYTREELIGKPISLLDDPETRKHIPERAKSLMSGKPLFFEGIHIRKDRSTFPVEISARLIHIQGKPYILATDRDITKRKKMESELKERMQLAELGADVGVALTKGQTISESLQLCTEALVKHLNVLFARIWVFDEHDNILKLQASSGLYSHIDGDHSRIQPGKLKIGIIAQSKMPHFTNKVLGDPLINDQEWVKREGIVSFAGHPLIVEDSLVGVMAMFSRRPLTNITIKALSYVADEIGLGIQQKLSEEKIIRAKEEWEKTFDTIPDIVTVTDNQYKIVRANKSLADRLNVERESLIGRFCYNVIHCQGEPPSDCPHSKTLADNKEYMAELYEKTLNGYFLLSCTPVFDPLGNLTTTVQVLRDISERKKIEEQLKSISITDELTGLFNRRGFFTLADKEFKLADRHKRRMSLIYLDLDGLKAINDKLGHEAGDHALVDSANILRKSFRDSDIMGRMGGDEFAVLITDGSEADIEKIAVAHFQQNLKIHNEQAGRSYTLLLSMGFAHYDPASPCTISELIKQADSSMYEDKKRHNSIII